MFVVWEERFCHIPFWGVLRNSHEVGRVVGHTLHFSMRQSVRISSLLWYLIRLVSVFFNFTFVLKECEHQKNPRFLGLLCVGRHFAR